MSLAINPKPNARRALLVAGIAALTGTLWPALASLVIPVAVALALLVWIRHRMGDPADLASSPAATRSHGSEDDVTAPPPARRPPAEFWLFAASAGAATAGLVTFGVISFHLTRQQVARLWSCPVVYAAAMAAPALAALVTGWADKRLRSDRGRRDGRRPLVTATQLVALALLIATLRHGPRGRPQAES